MSVLEVSGLSVGYDGAAVCDDISFTVEEGDYLCVIGENGAGKSTLIKTLLGLIPAVSGRIEKGAGFSGIGYLPQRTDDRKDFPATVEEIVLSGCLRRIGYRPFYGRREKALAGEKIAMMGIEPLRRARFADLSGGQQQKVLIARAMCAADGCLLLDEPVTGLDPAATEDLYRAIERLNDGGMTIIAVTHDVRGGLAYADKVLEMAGGKAFFGTAGEYRAHADGGRHDD